MKEIEFKRYNDQSSIWYYKFKPSMEAFPLSLDHNKFTSIGLSEHKEVPTYAQVNYMGFSKFFPTALQWFFECGRTIVGVRSCN